MAAKVEIYTTPFCPYCSRAKKLLEQKGVAFEEIDVMMQAGKRKEMRERAGGVNTVPQVFVDGELLGDCDFIHSLDATGELDQRLGLA